MGKAKEKERHRHQHKEEEPIWIEGHKLNEKTGKLEPVRYKLKWKRGK